MKKQIKKEFMSTDLFKGKVIPPVISEHELFRNPHKVVKVFPSIGLENFAEKVNPSRSLIDTKKENSYVYNVVSAINIALSNAATSAINFADKVQYLFSGEEQEKNIDKMHKQFKLAKTLKDITSNLDTSKADQVDKIIQTRDGKYVLFIANDVLGEDGKVMFHGGTNKKGGTPLFRIYGAMEKECLEAGITMASLEQMPEYKTFCVENVSKKEYLAIFSSEGPEGAWDIATMSMRGFSSCQRWDGDYPRCLVGSILSKYVGIIYLTSGSPSEPQGGYKDLGSKMMRRCIVRYAIDSLQQKPCLIMDKIYPVNTDMETVRLFTELLKQKSNLPVYYAPELGAKTKNFYIPSEKIVNKLTAKNRSYQDTPIKSKQEADIYSIQTQKEDRERETLGFKANLALFISRKLDAFDVSKVSLDNDIKNVVALIKASGHTYIGFSETFTQYVVNNFRPSIGGDVASSTEYYKKYLIQFIKLRNTTYTGVKNSVSHFIQTSIQPFSHNNISKSIEDKFCKLLFDFVVEFVKKEAIKTIG